jgi:hypothetical protein
LGLASTSRPNSWLILSSFEVHPGNARFHVAAITFAP